ncbi:MAG: PKD domain-containing protein, partial [Saprospiraceae bacterium]|nr:PKD domain-containing protein [Saprospiraceae bacterium]
VFRARASRDLDGSVVSHVWDFGDGKSASGETVYHDYAKAGTYRITLTVTDDRGASGTATTSLLVAGSAKAPPSIRPGGG